MHINDKNYTININRIFTQTTFISTFTILMKKRTHTIIITSILAHNFYFMKSYSRPQLDDFRAPICHTTAKRKHMETCDDDDDQVSNSDISSINSNEGDDESAWTCLLNDVYRLHDHEFEYKIAELEAKGNPNPRAIKIACISRSSLS